MSPATLATLISMIGVLSAISGIVLGWSGHSRSVRKDVVNEAGKDAGLRLDVEYIKRGVDEVRLEQRAQGQRFEALAERVTRVEESAKQAHHRIDRIDRLES